MKAFTVKHYRTGRETTVKAKSWGHVWKMIRANGGEPMHYRQVSSGNSITR